MFGRPIELISPLGVSNSRGGGLPARGAGVIVFETKALKGKLSSSASPNTRRAAIASKVPEPLTIGMLELQPGELDAHLGTAGHQWPDPGISAVSICPPSTTGPSTQSRM